MCFPKINYIKISYMKMRIVIKVGSLAVTDEKGGVSY